LRIPVCDTLRIHWRNAPACQGELQHRRFANCPVFRLEDAFSGVLLSESPFSLKLHHNALLYFAAMDGDGHFRRASLLNGILMSRSAGGCCTARATTTTAGESCLQSQSQPLPPFLIANAAMLACLPLQLRRRGRSKRVACDNRCIRRGFNQNRMNSCISLFPHAQCSDRVQTHVLNAYVQGHWPSL
jgi:hypothetical protein